MIFLISPNHSVDVTRFAPKTLALLEQSDRANAGHESRPVNEYSIGSQMKREEHVHEKERAQVKDYAERKDYTSRDL